MRRRPLNSDGQMVVWEAVAFSLLVIVSLFYCYQVMPLPSQTSMQTDASTLHQVGRDALYSLYDAPPSVAVPEGYPAHRLCHLLLSDDMGTFGGALRDLLPPTVHFNAYVSDGTSRQFLCSSGSEPVPSVGTAAVAHCAVAIDETFVLHYAPACLLALPNYPSGVFDVVLELWYE